MLARLSSSWLLAALARGYIWLFRSLPLDRGADWLLYNFSYLYDALSIGISVHPLFAGLALRPLACTGQFSLPPLSG